MLSMNGIKGDRNCLDLEWASLIQPPGYNYYMRLYRFKQFRTIIPKIYEHADLKDADSWWQFKGAIDDFNAIRNLTQNLLFVHLFAFGSSYFSSIVLLDRVISSLLKILDETIFTWRPRQTRFGRLPNISYVIRKPEPLGTEFKTVCYPITGVMTYIEIQRGKEGMKNMRLQIELGATAACTIRYAEGSHQVSEALKATVKGDAWFGSVNCTVALTQRGRAFVDQIKSNYLLLPKDCIEDKIKDEPGGTHIVIKATYQDVDSIAIGYRYSSKKTLHLFFQEMRGRQHQVNHMK